MLDRLITLYTMRYGSYKLNNCNAIQTLSGAPSPLPPYRTVSASMRDSTVRLDTRAIHTIKNPEMLFFRYPKKTHQKNLR
jgi:hypothetical protein